MKAATYRAGAITAHGHGKRCKGQWIFFLVRTMGTGVNRAFRTGTRDTGNGKRITRVVSFVSRDTSARHYNTDVQAVLNDETPWKL